MTKKKTGLLCILICILSICMIGCFLNPTGAADTDGDGVPDERDDDIDGDGLSNSYETSILRTNPIMDDTDGDGWSDGDEMNMGTMFSPLLANMPELQLIITSTPEIILTGENSSAESYEFTIAEGSSVTEETTTSTSLSESRSLENAWSLEGMVGYGIGADGFNCSLTTGYSGSYTVESGYSWGSEKTESNTQNIEQSRTYADEQSVTYDGGVLTVGARLYNPSNIAYTIDSFLVSGYRMNTLNSNYGQYSLLGSGNMTIDGFSSITLPSKSYSGEFILKQTFDSPEQAKSLATACPSMIFSISGYSLSMIVEGERTDFTEEMTTVAALCAKVIVSSNQKSPSKQFLVAARTLLNPEPSSDNDLYVTLSLADILQNMGYAEGIDYSTDTVNGHIDMLDGLAEDPAASSQWLVMVQDLENGLDFYTAEAGYDIGSIIIEPGYIVNICYSTDQDGDGLVCTIEDLYGSSDELLDSDGDTLNDVDEVLGWSHAGESVVYYTNPALADTDGDGFTDAEDDDPVSLSTNTSADIVGITITDRLGGETIYDEDKFIFEGNAIMGEYVDIEVKVLESVSGISIGGATMTVDPVDNKLYTYEINSIPVGINELPVSVTSEDGKTIREYTLKVDSRLEDFTELNLMDELLSDSGEKYQMDLGFNWGSYPDSRADGALLLYISGTDAVTSYQLPATTQPPRTLKQNPTADVFDSGETAVFYWDSRSAGAEQLQASSGSFFRASYYNRKYAFRIVPVAIRDGYYYYGLGSTEAPPFTTPYPDKIMIDDLYLRYHWDSIEGDESDPEFIINTNLVEPSAQGSGFLADITTRTDKYPWEPDANGDLDDHNDPEELDYTPLFDIPDSDRDASLFGIWSDIDEDDSVIFAGYHDCVDDTNYFQFIGPDGDGLYRINENNKYAGLSTVQESYHDNDKGDITIYYTFDYHSVGTE